MSDYLNGILVGALVSNLPLNGGWPHDAEVAITRDDGRLFFMTKDFSLSDFHLSRGSYIEIHGSSCERVSKNEYYLHLSKTNNIKLSQ